MINYIRWILIPIVGVLSWYLAVLIGLAAYQFAESLCPSEYIISGMCFAPWFATVSKLIIDVGAGLSALFVVLFSTLLAPSRKVEVAWFVFFTGLAVAIFIAFQANAFAELAWAGVFGLATAIVLTRHFKYSSLE